MADKERILCLLWQSAVFMMVFCNIINADFDYLFDKLEWTYSPCPDATMKLHLLQLCTKGQVDYQKSLVSILHNYSTCSIHHLDHDIYEECPLHNILNLIMWPHHGFSPTDLGWTYMTYTLTLAHTVQDVLQK